MKLIANTLIYDKIRICAKYDPTDVGSLMSFTVTVSIIDSSGTVVWSGQTSISGVISPCAEIIPQTASLPEGQYTLQLSALGNTYTYKAYIYANPKVVALDNQYVTGPNSSLVIAVINGMMYFDYRPEAVVYIPSAAQYVIYEISSGSYAAIYGPEPPQYPSTVVIPNATIPVLIQFDIVFADNIDQDTAQLMLDTQFYAYRVGIKSINNNVVTVTIAKDVPGVPILIAILIVLVIILLIQSIGKVITALANLKVSQAQAGLINEVKASYAQAVNSCGNDVNCIINVNRSYLPYLSNLTVSYPIPSPTPTPTSTGGITLFGINIPWWAVIFGLLVLIALVKK